MTKIYDSGISVLNSFFQYSGDPAEAMLKSWSTDFVTFRQLINCLTEAGLLRCADFVDKIIESSNDEHMNGINGECHIGGRNPRSLVHSPSCPATSGW